jgi:hypothetical protein
MSQEMSPFGTREQLDDLVKECQLSVAREFGAWLDQVWSAIEANRLDTVPAEMTLLDRGTARQA